MGMHNFFKAAAVWAVGASFWGCGAAQLESAASDQTGAAVEAPLAVVASQAQVSRHLLPLEVELLGQKTGVIEFIGAQGLGAGRTYSKEFLCSGWGVVAVGVGQTRDGFVSFAGMAGGVAQQWSADGHWLENCDQATFAYEPNGDREVLGSSGRPLVAGESLVVDPSFIALGTWVWVETEQRWFRADHTWPAVERAPSTQVGIFRKYDAGAQPVCQQSLIALSTVAPAGPTASPFQPAAATPRGGNCAQLGGGDWCVGDTLLRCNRFGQELSRQDCAHGCEQKPIGTPDACRPAPAAPTETCPTAAPPAPTGLSPSGPAEQPARLYGGTAAELRWQPVAGATRYFVTLARQDTAGAAETPVGSWTTSGASQTVSLPDAVQRYVFRVQSAHAGGLGAVAQGFFQTELAVPTPARPGAPEGQPQMTVHPYPELTFEWSAVSGATAYQVSVQEQQQGGAWTDVILGRDPGAATQLSVLMSGRFTLHRWKVRAFVGGQWRAWSQEFYFTLGNSIDPNQVRLISPTSSSGITPTVSADATVFTFSEVPNAYYYLLELSVQQQGVWGGEWSTIVYGTSTGLSGLQRGVLYRWRVRAVMSDGTQSPWSTYGYFNTQYAG